ncbi:MAG TPA: hypothetical protein PK566_18975 [Pseudobacteroides sp.]|nr:hypothetical protein [Pseudobacteroides sp.]
MNQDYPKGNEIKIVNIAIFPIGMTSNTYFFKLSSDGYIESMFGTIKSNNIRDENFIEHSDSVSKKLALSEQQNIVKLIGEIENDKTVLKKAIRKEGWEVLMSINNNEYNFNYGDYMDNCYGKLVKLVIEYSPLKVDIHGWS